MCPGAAARPAGRSPPSALVMPWKGSTCSREEENMCPGGGEHVPGSIENLVHVQLSRAWIATCSMQLCGLRQANCPRKGGLFHQTIPSLLVPSNFARRGCDFGCGCGSVRGLGMPWPPTRRPAKRRPLQARPSGPSRICLPFGRIWFATRPSPRHSGDGTAVAAWREIKVRKSSHDPASCRRVGASEMPRAQHRTTEGGRAAACSNSGNVSNQNWPLC